MTKYAQIAAEIRNQIMSGIYKSNDQLPFEKELCKRYDTSKMTVKKALDMLMSEGLIIKRRGAGTFVKDINIKDMQQLIASNQFRGFTATNIGKMITTDILEYDVIKAPKEVAEQLKVQENEFVYKILRVRLLDNIPRALENTYMPIDLIKGLKRDHLKGSLYEYIEDELKLKIQSSHRIIEIKKADAFVAQYLELKEDEPIGVVKQVAFLDNGQAFEYSITFHSYKYFKFETVLLR